jgi:hypothetical protein
VDKKGVAVDTEEMFFGDAHLERAVEATRTAAVLLEEYVADGGVGHPRLLTVPGLLAGMHLACLESGGSVHLERAAHILAWQIPSRWRLRFGMEETLPRTAHAFEAIYARVRRLFHALETVMDSSPLPKNRRLSEQAYADFRETRSRLATCGGATP